jgi:hypothetical protein
MHVCSRGKDADPSREFAILFNDELFRPKAVDDERENSDSDVTQLQKPRQKRERERDVILHISRGWLNTEESKERD